MTRVFVVDDHAVVRSGVRAEIGDTMEIVGEAGDVAAAIDGIRATRPDVVLLDVHLPDGGGRAVLDAWLAGNGDGAGSLKEQFTPWLRATPRGSNPTTSNRRRISSLNWPEAKMARSTPEPPGPPGLSTSEPIRAAGSVAGRRASARAIRSPPGRLQSTGTESVAHRAAGSSAQGVQTNPPLGLASAAPPTETVSASPIEQANNLMPASSTAGHHHHIRSGPATILGRNHYNFWQIITGWSSGSAT